MDSKKIKLSILIPAYNAADYIERCINSILKQPALFEVEIIVINDGSTDDTQKIVNDIAKLHANIHLFTTKNQGVYKARNYGITKLTGDYVWMLDADDYIAAQAFKILYEAFKIDKQVDVFHLGYKQEIKTSVFETRQPPGNNHEILDGVEFLKRNDGRLFLWNNIYRLAFLKARNLHFLAKSVSLEDSLFNIQVFSKANRVMFIKECLYLYMINTSSISRTKSESHLLKQGQSSINVHIHTKQWRNSFSKNSKQYAVINQKLNHSILGFFYSLYVEKYSQEYIKNIFKLYQKEGLLPIYKSTKNAKLAVFQKMINLKWPFLWICKLK